jgi:hypothetical protein
MNDSIIYPEYRSPRLLHELGRAVPLLWGHAAGRSAGLVDAYQCATLALRTHLTLPTEYKRFALRFELRQKCTLKPLSPTHAPTTPLRSCLNEATKPGVLNTRPQFRWTRSDMHTKRERKWDLEDVSTRAHVRQPDGTLPDDLLRHVVVVVPCGSPARHAPQPAQGPPLRHAADRGQGAGLDLYLNRNQWLTGQEALRAYMEEHHPDCDLLMDDAEE